MKKVFIGIGHSERRSYYTMVNIGKNEVGESANSLELLLEIMVDRHGSESKNNIVLEAPKELKNGIFELTLTDKNLLEKHLSEYLAKKSK
ncbi:MAG: hypothetical protein KAS78_00795 [Candidatus Pacebacteria bacterium]|nr:hypothetical protein [Candidatus Paceibacterota bacterium]